MIGSLTRLLLLALLALLPSSAYAAIDGLHGTSFDLTAKADHVSLPDGGSMYFWGFAANGASRPQYPGPTLIVGQGETITVNLTNTLPFPVSLLFPGQPGVQASGGTQGAIAIEAAPGATVTYTFVAREAGTYLYHSGSRPELQVEMGLFGAMIVRPYGFDPASPRAYADADTAYDREVLFLLSEMDPRLHQLIELQGLGALAGHDYLSDYFPAYWFINGRAAPDTMSEAGTSRLATQPYNCMPRMHPGERLLMRVIDAGRDLHPFHNHGNHARVIARDGRLLRSAPNVGLDLSHEVFTVQAVPGQTTDAIFTWTGKDLGWDIYGHAAGDPVQPGEWAPDHGKPFPVILPTTQELTLGAFYSGSPFLGTLEQVPPGEGGMNPNGGFLYMWHSHTEKEMTNWDIFPGGMMTMLIIEAPGVEIPEGM